MCARAGKRYTFAGCHTSLTSVLTMCWIFPFDIWHRRTDLLEKIERLNLCSIYAGARIPARNLIKSSGSFISPKLCANRGISWVLTIDPKTESFYIFSHFSQQVKNVSFEDEKEAFTVECNNQIEAENSSHQALKRAWEQLSYRIRYDKSKTIRTESDTE